MNYKVVCSKCGNVENDFSFRCSKCNSILEVKYEYNRSQKLFDKKNKGIRRYINILPVKKIYTLGEGNTQLASIKIDGIDNAKLFFKLENQNPTKTFKDRGSCIEISKAVELGIKKVCCASTGNMGLSVAHYAKHFGINATIFIGKNANRKKISRIRKQGAKIVFVDGDFNKALNAAEEYSGKTGAFVCGDYHFRKEGQKTLAFEVAEQMKFQMPDYLFIPVGNGTLFSGVYKGLEELKSYKLIRNKPRMVAVQSEKCDPVIVAYRNRKNIKYMKPRTEADAIAVGYPTFGFETLNAIKGTKGNAVSVSEKEIESAVRTLEDYGINAELGGGTGFAGFLKMHSNNKKIFKSKSVAVVITGNNEGRFV
ncbi:MAG: pyridoxal-phosphate dependent enzyme [Candidatus Micrarchaeaceae archaeon]